RSHCLSPPPGSLTTISLSPTHDRPPPTLHSPPTRRSSDLGPARPGAEHVAIGEAAAGDESTEVVQAMAPGDEVGHVDVVGVEAQDRKSTRLNSSHVKISYAVFCLKKKKQLPENQIIPPPSS